MYIKKSQFELTSSILFFYFKNYFKIFLLTLILLSVFTKLGRQPLGFVHYSISWAEFINEIPSVIKSSFIFGLIGFIGDGIFFHGFNYNKFKLCLKCHTTYKRKKDQCDCGSELVDLFNYKNI